MACSKDNKSSREVLLLVACNQRCDRAAYGYAYMFVFDRMGRDIAYDHWSCDLLCAASSPDLY